MITEYMMQLRKIILIVAPAICALTTTQLQAADLTIVNALKNTTISYFSGSGSVCSNMLGSNGVIPSGQQTVVPFSKLKLFCNKQSSCTLFFYPNSSCSGKYTIESINLNLDSTQSVTKIIS
jgi:hypothetical protein